MRAVTVRTAFLSAVVCLLLTACGFHLRETTELPADFQTVGLKGVGADEDLSEVLKRSFIDARSRLVAGSDASIQLTISDLDEDKRVASYDADLSVRQYLIYLLFDYTITRNGKVVAEQRVRLDKTMIYDADFILGKQEEESKIRESLREDAARLILLRMKSITH